MNHKDENKLNNHISNLEWITPKENKNWGTRNERIAAKLGNPVQQINEKGQIIATYPSMNEAERQTGISNATISLVCNGRRKTAGGYIWRKV